MQLGGTLLLWTAGHGCLLGLCPELAKGKLENMHGEPASGILISTLEIKEHDAVLFLCLSVKAARCILEKRTFRFLLSCNEVSSWLAL